MKKSFLYFGLITLLSFVSVSPTYAATDVRAGFAPGPIWLSQNTLTAGDTVKIYTVVYDSENYPIEGVVSFLVDGTVVGTTPFQLNAGESAIRSIEWTSTEGSHVMSAEITSALDSSTKNTTHVASTTTSISIAVVPVPTKIAAVETVNTDTSSASTTPAAQNILTTAGAITESIRTAGESYLTKLTTTQAESAPKGEVLGVETQATSTSDTAPKANIGHTVAQTLLPVFKYPALFYPVFALVLFIILWIIAWRLRNPSRKKR